MLKNLSPWAHASFASSVSLPLCLDTLGLSVLGYRAWGPTNYILSPKQGLVRSFV